MIYTVCESKRYGNSNPFGNRLAYNDKTSEYIYYHKRKKIWTCKASSELFDYVEEYHSRKIPYLDRDKMLTFEVYKKYEEDCNKYSK